MTTDQRVSEIGNNRSLGNTTQLWYSGETSHIIIFLLFNILKKPNQTCGIQAAGKGNNVMDEVSASLTTRAA